MSVYLTHQEIIEKCASINEQYHVNEQFFDRIIDELLNSELPTEDVILNGFEQLLGEVDHEIGRIEAFAGMEASCFKGCAFCCYFPIVITKMEAKMMLRAIERFPKERKEYIYQHWEGYFGGETDKLETAMAMDFNNEETKLAYKQLNVPCPMLDPETHTCLAYEIRPIPCRTYLNYADPKVCAENDLPKETFSYEFLYEYYMGAMNEILQALYENGEDLLVNYPTDLWEYDYLPAWIMKRNEVMEDEL
ncbi:YkgJ family cysteine cluster protein [Thalassobacillus sp. CUG 92003]|uniref:YkgJ family cysteine cluster protein n=1 Tax=Thalassobacillus sp. CUG 92003 TaxID=2736641 RepID=UPI0015E76652|nr:YkgJ family cysteine cluster protein [Thalassobacillus sp. CUG 92003]